VRIITDEGCTGYSHPGHPERPERIFATRQRLRTQTELPITWSQSGPCDDAAILRAHTTEHLARLSKLEDFDEDTPSYPNLPAYARASVGAALAALKAARAGETVFSLMRPPGHHATRNRAMGFCLFNNVAIAARYIQRHHKLPKVLIVDWDVHHGNGTQAVFDDDPGVFYFSVHQHPFYPGTGTADERGAGKAEGTKLNVPLPAGSGDTEYRRAFVEQLVPAADRFQPDFVLVSAGFDAHADDTLGGMRVTTQCYGDLTRIVRQIADRHCQGRLVSVLEGGYGLDGLAASVEAHLRVLLD